MKWNKNLKNCLNRLGVNFPFRKYRPHQNDEVQGVTFLKMPNVELKRNAEKSLAALLFAVH